MSTPASPLLDFVTRLQDDSELQGQFAADPVGTMTAAGLSADDQAIVQSRDLARLKAAIFEQTGERFNQNATSVLFDPEPGSGGA